LNPDCRPTVSCRARRICMFLSLLWRAAIHVAGAAQVLTLSARQCAPGLHMGAPEVAAGERKPRVKRRPAGFLL